MFCLYKKKEVEAFKKAKKKTEEDHIISCRAYYFLMQIWTIIILRPWIVSYSKNGQKLVVLLKKKRMIIENTQFKH
jgi:hypothetical protein